MAITTMTGALAGMTQPVIFAKATPTLAAGRMFTLWAQAGMPAAGAYNATLNGVALTSAVTGQLPWTDPAAGNSYLQRLSVNCSGSTISGQLILCDRLWHNGGYTITLTSAQATTFPTLVARDVAGSTNGDGVLLAVEVSATVGAATPTITIAYTNSAGTASRSATNLDATVSAAVTGSVYRIALQAGDTGVRSVQSLTLSASYLSGTINLVAYRPIATVEFSGGLQGAIDAITSAFPRIYNGSVPYFMILSSSAAAVQVAGTVQFTQG